MDVPNLDGLQYVLYAGAMLALVGVIALAIWFVQLVIFMCHHQLILLPR